MYFVIMSFLFIYLCLFFLIFYLSYLFLMPFLLISYFCVVRGGWPSGLDAMIEKKTNREWTGLEKHFADYLDAPEGHMLPWLVCRDCKLYSHTYNLCFCRLYMFDFAVINVSLTSTIKDKMLVTCICYYCY